MSELANLCVRVPVAAPEFDDHWWNIEVQCETCGPTIIALSMKVLSTQPALECPICKKPTGQQITVDVQ